MRAAHCNICRAAIAARYATKALAGVVIIMVILTVTPVLATAARGALYCGAGYIPAVHHTITGMEEDAYWDTYCAPHGY